jgi:hypothetical protein
MPRKDSLFLASLTALVIVTALATAVLLLPPGFGR